MIKKHKYKDDIKRIRKNPYKAFSRDLFLRPLKENDFDNILKDIIDKRFVLSCTLRVVTSKAYYNIPIKNKTLNNKVEILKCIEKYCPLNDLSVLSYSFEYNIKDLQGRVYASIFLKEKDDTLDRVVNIKTTIKELKGLIPKKYSRLLLDTLNNAILRDITKQTKSYQINEIPQLIIDKKDILSHKQIKQLEMIYKVFLEPSKYLGKSRILKGKIRNKLKGSYILDDTLYKNGKEYELFTKGDDKECSEYIW